MYLSVLDIKKSDFYNKKSILNNSVSFICYKFDINPCRLERTVFPLKGDRFNSRFMTNILNYIQNAIFMKSHFKIYPLLLVSYFIN
ncbi:hypothetical protein HYN43_009640 [Mucilaginibacter celer]|uniref:Uncharacterized protein n=1 Tax=Mucilaginibacter celer TaxID=2305508 RepID=A0A494VK87_9SPHI|nr:hypothetical protein HYN43_009640 [Mucilaginibacter celer]